ncbi:MAG: O-antigen ligase family protein, partial [Syntrophomonas sp.]
MSSKKIQKNKKPETKTKTKSLFGAEQWFSIIVFIAVAVLVFYPPYFRGLFFNEDMFVYHIITGLVFILVWIEKISRKEFNFLETPLDWAILAYAGAYLLSLTGAVHIGEAIYGFLKALNYFMVYFMVTQVVRDYRRYEYMLKIILASGVGVAAVGILAAVGLSQYPSAFTYENNIARILSTLQYPNTTAAYLAVISLIGVTLWIRERNPLMKLIYGTSIYILILVVLAALSKGAWLIFILGAILLLLGMPGIYRFKSVYILVLAGVAALLTYPRFISAIPAATGGEPVAALKLLLFGLLILILGQIIWELGVVLYHKTQKPWLAAYIISLGLVALFLSYHFLPVNELAGKIAPDTLKARAEGITDTSSISYTSRLDYGRWGIEIVRDHPVTGAGAGGWNALYHQYQDYLAWTTETHNHFVQVAVEAGTLGFIAFISLWICLLFALFKSYKAAHRSKSVDNWILNWGTATAALALGIHAAIDFDLSLGAMTILLWTLFALLNAGARISTEPGNKQVFKPVINISLAVIIAFVMLFLGSNFSLANNYAREGDGLLMEVSKPGQTAVTQDKLTQAGELFTRAAMADPYNANYHGSLAQAYALQWSQAAQAKNPAAGEYYEKAKEEIKRAGGLGPYNIKLRNALVNLCLGLNDPEGAVEQAHWAIQANPNDINAYEGLMQLSLKAAEFYLNQNNLDKASYYVWEIVKQPQAIKEQTEKINPERTGYPYWNGKTLNPSPIAQLTLG